MNIEMLFFFSMGGRGIIVVCFRLIFFIVVRGIVLGMWGSWGIEFGDFDLFLKDMIGIFFIYFLFLRAGEFEFDRIGKKDVWLVMFDNKKIINNFEKKCNINWCN